MSPYKNCSSRAADQYGQLRINPHIQSTGSSNYRHCQIETNKYRKDNSSTRHKRDHHPALKKKWHHTEPFLQRNRNSFKGFVRTKRHLQFFFSVFTKRTLCPSSMRQSKSKKRKSWRSKIFHNLVILTMTHFSPVMKNNL